MVQVGCSAAMRWDRIIGYGNDSIDDMDRCSDRKVLQTFHEYRSPYGVHGTDWGEGRRWRDDGADRQRADSDLERTPLRVEAAPYQPHRCLATLQLLSRCH